MEKRTDSGQLSYDLHTHCARTYANKIKPVFYKIVGVEVLSAAEVIVRD